MIDIDRIRSEFPDRAIDYYTTIDSTMTAAAGRPRGTAVLAEEQTAGQGRHGHSWDSQPGGGIYCSIVLEPAPLLTLALGLAAAEAITRATGIACDLRWPNDVMIRSRKVAGILVQLSDGAAIAGIGINVNQVEFPPALRDVATSLRLIAGREFSRTSILLGLLASVDGFIREDNETILRLFHHASSYASGRRVSVDQPGGVIEGVTAGLNSDGFLVVRRDDGTNTLILAGGVRAAGS